MIRFGRIFFVFLALLLANPAVFGGDRPWLEVTSPHFRVITDGSEGDGRHVAHEFEQMRSVFAQNFQGFRLDTGSPLLILAARDEATLKTLAPEFWKTKGIKPAGFYSRVWEQQYAVVRLDTVAPGSYGVIYHEYIHALLHMNFRWLPTWLDEGLAEFYGNTRFQKDHIFVGAPSPRGRYLSSQSLIPVETMIKVSPGSPYYHDPDKVQLFYAECWALVHYLILGPDMGAGSKLGQFYGLIQQRTDETKAFTQVFGDFAKLDKKLSEYTTAFTLPAVGFKPGEQLEDKSYGVRKLSVAETDAELGLFYFYRHNLDEARTQLASALQADPKLGLAHQGMAFLDFHDGKDEDAQREFSQAYELDHKLYLSLFFKTMMSGHTQAPEDLTGFNLALQQIVEINPIFAPAYVELARMHLRKGSLETALTMARKSERMEPSRAGYFLLVSRILTRMGRGRDAATIASFVANRWSGPDHNEAVQAWREIPAVQRPSGEVLEDQVAEGSQTLEGTLAAVTCGDKDHKLELTVDHEGQPMKFRAKGGFWSGFPDTLWYGRDHFSLCHHLTGSHVVIRYKAPPDTSYAGNLTGVEIRDLLPEAVPAAAEPAKAN
jgi:Tfp pilus assembly protein PilF